MTAASMPGTVSRVARAVVLAFLTVGLLAGCGSASTDLCKQAATQQLLGELDMAAVSYARAERENPKGCGKKGLEAVAEDQAEVAVAVARGQAAEKAQDNDEAIAAYARALRLDVREGTALYGLRRLVRTTTDVGPHWQVAMTLKEQGFTDRARAEVAQVIEQYPKESVPTALATLAPDYAAPAGATKQPTNDQLGAAALSSPVDMDDGGPSFLTVLTWIVLAAVGAIFLTLVVLSRGGNEHVVPRAFAGAADLADKFAVRQGAVRASRATRATRAPSLAGVLLAPAAGSAGAPVGTPTQAPQGTPAATSQVEPFQPAPFQPAPSEPAPSEPAPSEPPAYGPRHLDSAAPEGDQASDPESGRRGGPEHGVNGFAHAATGGADGQVINRTLAGTTVDEPLELLEPAEPVDLLTPEESAVVSGALLAAHVADPSAAPFTPAPVDAPPAVDGAATALDRPAHPSRWKLRGVRKRRSLPPPPEPEELEPHLLGVPATTAASVASASSPGPGAPAQQQSSDALMNRVVLLERRHQAQQNELARLSSRKDAEVTSVLVTSARSPWQALHDGEDVRLIVADTRVYWSGKGREPYAPGSLVVRQTTATVDDAQRDELLDLAVPAPLEDATWHVGRLTELLDGLTEPPGAGRWTGWWESPGHLRFDRVSSNQGSITDQWRPLVLAEPVPEADSDVALAPLLPLTGPPDVRLRTTVRLRDVANNLELEDGAALPAGRQVYALTIVTTADRSVSIAALERSVGRDALSQAISREVLDTFDENLGVVGTGVVDVLATTGPGAARHKALRQMLDGARQELKKAADAQA